MFDKRQFTTLLNATGFWHVYTQVSLEGAGQHQGKNYLLMEFLLYFNMEY